MRPFRLFLAHSFSRLKVNRYGKDDPGGYSDLELADKVVSWIEELAGPRIEVVRTRDPFHGYISSEVRRDICRSDAVLCLFAMRTWDGGAGHWIASTYVISEAAAALMQFRNEEETHHRLFGLVEEGVGREQLGMAFHGNKVASTFRRDDPAHLKSLVKGIVDTILDDQLPLPHRNELEYLSIDKVATIWPNRSVLVETEHRFRSTAEIYPVRIPHTMWRVSSELPPIETVHRENRKSGAGFLRVVSLGCGKYGPELCKARIRSMEESTWGYERHFFVEFPDVRIQPGDELVYRVVWGYPNAFHHPPDSKPDPKPNSVGLRTSARGIAESASLALRFMRGFEEDVPILENPPEVHTTHLNSLPGGQSPEDFLHKHRSWRKRTELHECREMSCATFEVYHWRTGAFGGMAKAIWTPHWNYFDRDEPMAPAEQQLQPQHA